MAHFSEAWRQNPEFTSRERRDLEARFKEFDEDGNHFIDQFELQRMFEKMGEPKTHLQLKNMIKEVASNPEQGISFADFIGIVVKQRKGDNEEGSAAGMFGSIADPSLLSAKDKKKLFEAAIAEQSKGAKTMEEIKAESQRRKDEAEAARKRKEEFKARIAAFGNNKLCTSTTTSTSTHACMQVQSGGGVRGEVGLDTARREKEVWVGVGSDDGVEYEQE
eukprot:CAMPEP_0113916950 /NCGR_PEP_ID=MMETSP0780_2-20120614/32381_1 /TAXON_ID=652834 /ORGANISM="Palpitomonas bilix" /LENGTH=219 /DNA_ID=CAMNT_0000916305 /DNA_START=75 /DNA_END=736 /DNA_ORIENTATION=+ /assembly_acc=CAM_ASM_000599